MCQSVLLSTLVLEKTKTAHQSKKSMKQSSIAEHLVNNPSCGNNFEISNFSVMRQCSNILDLIRLDLIRLPLFTTKND